MHAASSGIVHTACYPFGTNQYPILAAGFMRVHFQAAFFVLLAFGVHAQNVGTNSSTTGTTSSKTSGPAVNPFLTIIGLEATH